MKVPGVSVQDLATRLPDLPPAENLTPETYIWNTNGLELNTMYGS
jgi:hypothetical protein